MTRREAGELLALLLAAYPHARIDEPSAGLYARTLTGFDANVGRTAIEHVIRDCRLFPSLNELLSALQIEARRAARMGQVTAPALPLAGESRRDRGLAGVAAARKALKSARGARRAPGATR